MENINRGVRWFSTVIFFTNLVCLGLCNSTSQSSGLNRVVEGPCAEGRYPHPIDCTKFLECIKGSLRERRCATGAFDDQKKECDTQVAGCKQGRRGKAYTATPHLNFLCETKTAFVCSDCSTLVQCINGVAYSESCYPGDTCIRKKNFAGGVCYPEPSDECSCAKGEKLMKNPHSDRSFLYCKTPASFPKTMACPVNTLYKEKKRSCTGKDGTPSCYKNGKFAFLEDCTQFYECIETESGFLQIPMECDKGKMYNEQKDKCENPCRWGNGDFECKEEGRFSDPADCQNFYECMNSDGGFLKRSKMCPDGNHWFQKTKKNGFCNKKSKSKCREVKTSECKIPDGMCSNEVEGTEEDTTENPTSEEPHESGSGMISENEIEHDGNKMDEEDGTAGKEQESGSGSGDESQQETTTSSDGLTEDVTETQETTIETTTLSDDANLIEFSFTDPSLGIF